jgi:hypothetical protein
MESARLLVHLTGQTNCGTAVIEMVGEADLSRLLRLTFISLVAEPGCYGAIDPNKIYQVFLFRRGHERKGLSHHEHAQVQQVLACLDR